ncbi:MAG TPA: DNA translocase FtsK 4TM domain-containing protein, partial [Devosia sp.]|nr:DNA translocase FtsK 4TM domain-containing protein [Devosia sp.]
MPTHPTPMLDEVRSIPARASRPRAKITAPVAPKAISIHIPLRLVGLVMLVVVGICLAALASWSVDDPSFSYATAKEPANWLGFPGAAIADILFQTLGLAALVLVVSPALWGWALARRRTVTRMGLRAMAWFGSTILAAGVLSFIAMPATWPLPTGLGGLVGGVFSNTASAIAGAPVSGLMGTLFAIIIAIPTLALFWIGMGLGATVAAAPQKPSAAAMARRGQAAQDEPEPETNPLVDIVLGAMVHTGYSLRTAFRRARENHAQRRAEEASFRDGAQEPDLDISVEPSMDRREPSMAPSQRRIHAPVEPGFDAPRTEPRINAPSSYDDTELDYPDEPDDADLPFVPDAQPGSAVVNHHQRGDSRFHPAPPPNGISPRVAAPPARPVQGQRVAREAQGSFLDMPQGFELPPLSLLAEPRHKGPSEEHNPERLEAMARQLEGVLEDFGVKGDIINVRPGPVVTLFELEPAPGIKSSRVISLADDIARSMSAISARVAVVPGRNAIGIELPNHNREMVYFREMLASSDFEKMKGKLPICLGKTIGGEPVIADLARMPHLL